MCQHSIANIDINKDYDESLGTEEVHYQSFSRMAAFFGRDMQAHRHDRYFQMHYLDTGQIELQLDDHRYSVQAPLFVITPPSVPHAFITESDSAVNEIAWQLGFKDPAYFARFFSRQVGCSPSSYRAQKVPVS